MQDFFDYDNTMTDAQTQLMININADAEQDFLKKIGGANARKSDVGAMADQYNGTTVKTLCFAGSDKKALAIWAERCRVLGLTSLLTVIADENAIDEIADSCADGILLDCREIEDFSIIDKISAASDALLYVLVSSDVEVSVLSVADWTAVHGVVVCSDEKRCKNDLPVQKWLSEITDLEVFAGIGDVLCEANGRVWHPTPEILNGTAVSYLAKGCNGLWLDGYCADIFNPDSGLYDIYELCGDLSECVGTKRRHIQLCEVQKIILPGADYHFTADIAPVFDGAPVCLVLAAEGAKGEQALTVFCHENELQYTGEPFIISRNDKGRLCENQCIPVSSNCFEYYLGNNVSDEPLSLRIHNNTKNNVILCWAELSVNI